MRPVDKLSKLTSNRRMLEVGEIPQALPQASCSSTSCTSSRRITGGCPMTREMRGRVCKSAGQTGISTNKEGEPDR